MITPSKQIGKQGLLFITINDSLSTFIGQILGLKCTTVGYYYSTLINGHYQYHTYMMDLKTGKVPLWFESGKPLDKINNKEIYEIYLIPLKDQVDKSVFRQFQLELLQMSESLFKLPNRYITIINNLYKGDEYVDVSELYEKETLELWKTFAQRIGYSCKQEIRLPSISFDPMILYYKSRLERQDMDKIIVKDWLKGKIDEMFENITSIDVFQEEKNEGHPQIKQLKQQIVGGTLFPITIDLNKLWKSMGIKELMGEYSVPIVGIVSNKEKHELQLKFENGTYEVISNKFPNLDRFSVEELQEILMALDVSPNNLEFEHVRLDIVERIIWLESRK